MKIFLNDNKEIDYVELNSTTTVQDLLNAIDEFLEANPLDCEHCKERCCKRYAIEVDNVFVRANCRGNDDRFIDTKLKYDQKLNKFCTNGKKYCRYLNGLEKCDLYKTRPLICRLYMCYSYSKHYLLLQSLISHVFTTALMVEWGARVTGKSVMDVEPTPITNPVVNADDYSIRIQEIMPWSEYNIDDDERETFSFICSQVCRNLLLNKETYTE